MAAVHCCMAAVRAGPSTSVPIASINDGAEAKVLDVQVRHAGWSMSKQLQSETSSPQEELIEWHSHQNGQYACLCVSSARAGQPTDNHSGDD